MNQPVNHGGQDSTSDIMKITHARSPVALNDEMGKMERLILLYENNISQLNNRKSRLLEDIPLADVQMRLELWGKLEKVLIEINENSKEKIDFEKVVEKMRHDSLSNGNSGGQGGAHHVEPHNGDPHYHVHAPHTLAPVTAGFERLDTSFGDDEGKHSARQSIIVTGPDFVPKLVESIPKLVNFAENTTPERRHPPGQEPQNKPHPLKQANYEPVLSSARNQTQKPISKPLRPRPPQHHHKPSTTHSSNPPTSRSNSPKRAVPLQISQNLSKSTISSNPKVPFGFSHTNHKLIGRDQTYLWKTAKESANQSTEETQQHRYYSNQKSRPDPGIHAQPSPGSFMKKNIASRTRNSGRKKADGVGSIVDGPLKHKHYELLVIGAGSGGLALINHAYEFGVHAAIVESSKIGGVCTSTGGVPTKLMIHLGEAIRDAKDVASKGAMTLPGGVEFDWSYIKKIRDQYLLDLQTQSTDLLNKEKFDIISGYARFLSPKELKVND